MNMQVVDIPADKSVGGRFAPVLDQIETLPKGKCVHLAERLRGSDEECLRMGARNRGYKVHVKRGPEGTYVWKKEAKQ